MKNVRKNIAGMYFTISLLAFFVQPNEKAELTNILIYYSIALSNLIVCVILINYLFKKSATK